MKTYSERDWRLFRKKLADWQENYMAKLNREYIEILSRDTNASDNFWELEERIRKDKKNVGVSLRLSRSNMFYNILELIRNEVITVDDISEFSDELKEDIDFILNL